MSRYFNYSFWFDLLILFVLSVLLYGFIYYDFIKVNYSSISKVDGVANSLITVSATMIGFFLTVITIIVTFKKAFDIEKNKDENKNKKLNIFDKIFTIDEQMFGTDIVKRILNVFLISIYQLVICLFVLLIIELRLVFFPNITLIIALFDAIVLLIISVFKGLLIFHIFIKKHINP